MSRTSRRCEARIRERETPLRWAARDLAGGATLPSTAADLTAGAVTEDLMANFVALAAAEGETLPPDAASHACLRELLLRAVASARWGVEGYCTTGVRLDPEVRAAIESLPDAERLLQ